MSTGDAEDRVALYAMVCTVAEWDGARGYMLSDDGDRVGLRAMTFGLRQITHPLKVGDRVHCYVRAEVSYSLSRIRLVVPQEAPPEHIERLKALGKGVRAREAGRLTAEVEFREVFAGTIETYNSRKKSGVIRRDDGEPVGFDAYTLGLHRLKPVKRGMRVRFEACYLEGSWQIVRLLPAN
jgi:cold shock CspA family protein